MSAFFLTQPVYIRPNFIVQLPDLSTLVKHFLLTAGLLVAALSSHAQVGIGTSTPHPSAQLEITSPDKGLLIPRVLYSNRPQNPAEGLMIYQTNGEAGLYVYSGSSWSKMVNQQEVTPKGYAFYKNTYDGNTEFTAPSIWGKFISFNDIMATEDFGTSSSDRLYLHVLKAGYYKLEFDITPQEVSGANYIAILNLNGAGVQGSYAYSTDTNLNTHGNVITWINAGTEVSILIIPQNSNIPDQATHLKFRGGFAHGASMTITKLQ